MGCQVKLILKHLFIKNWQRKLIALILATIIWLLVNHSLISEKTYSNIPVRVRNIPKGMIIPNMKSDGYLTEKINLKIVGYKKILDQLSHEDIQVVLNAESQNKDWVAIIRKNEVVFLNKFINPYPYIRTINHDPFVVPMITVDPKLNDRSSNR